MRLIAIYLTGLIFGLGISLSGMGNPAKVLNFFDLAESWDPSLIFVMGGALAVTLMGYRLILPRSGPVFGGSFRLPPKGRIDARLIGGSAVFGIGWGIAGFCPGASLPALGTLNPSVAIFVASMIAGIWIARRLQAANRMRTT